MAKERPNLLVIMSDQHNSRVLGCAGDPFVRTPNLDALAAGGVQFRRAYCANPLCGPSRMTFLTSRHCSDIAMWSNSDVLSSDIPTFAHSLGAAGYETVLCGRMHFSCADHRHGFERRLVGDVTEQWPGTAGADLGSIPATATGQTRTALEVAGAGRTAYQAFDRAVTDAAADFLKQRGATGTDRPFCLVVGYVLPHCPYICPKDLFDEYYEKIDVPRMCATERENLHPAVRIWRTDRGVDGVPDEMVRKARAAYYSLVTMTDAFVGELADLLRDTGLAEDTAVFYCSDHGDLAGTHEMWWKACHYEGSVGVPLVASWPGRFAEGIEVDVPVSLLDLAPTFTDLANAHPLPEACGRSIVSFLEGDGAPPAWTDEIMAECAPGFGEPPSRMVCRGPWKLIHHHGYDTPQLFNLEGDPGEVRDLAHDPTCRAIRATLHERAKQDWSGERIMQAQETGKKREAFLRAWAERVRPPEPDHWVAPPGCNVFPET